MSRTLAAFIGGFTFVCFCMALGAGAASCGQTLFPKCTTAEPCPPCTGFEKDPDPCVGRARDAGRR